MQTLVKLHWVERDEKCSPEREKICKALGQDRPFPTQGSASCLAWMTGLAFQNQLMQKVNHSEKSGFQREVHGKTLMECVHYVGSGRQKKLKLKIKIAGRISHPAKVIIFLKYLKMSIPSSLFLLAEFKSSNAGVETFTCGLDRMFIRLNRY